MTPIGNLLRWPYPYTLHMLAFCVGRELSEGATPTTPWHMQCSTHLSAEKIVHLSALSQPPAAGVTLFVLLRVRLVVGNHCGHGVQACLLVVLLDALLLQSVDDIGQRLLDRILQDTAQQMQRTGIGSVHALLLQALLSRPWLQHLVLQEKAQQHAMCDCHAHGVTAVPQCQPVGG